MKPRPLLEHVRTLMCLSADRHRAIAVSYRFIARRPNRVSEIQQCLLRQLFLDCLPVYFAHSALRARSNRRVLACCLQGGRAPLV